MPTNLYQRADVADAPEILALQRFAYRSEAEFYGDCYMPALTQTLDELTASFARNTVLKAVHHGRIVGSVNGRMSKERCLVARLMVHPEMQGRGIGTELMAAIEREFPHADAYRLFTGERSVRNIRLYERLGYRIYERREVPGSFGIVFMEKKAASAADSSTYGEAE